jgi:cytochrome c oxidase cbb3-type subunit 3
MIRSTIPNRIARLAPLAALAVLLAPMNALAGDAEKGKGLYTINCASCHGDTGKGDGPVAIAVPPPPPRDFAAGDFKFDADEDGTVGTDADLKTVITKGAAAFGGNPMMATWGGILSDEDIDNLVAYIRTLKQ